MRAEELAERLWPGQPITVAPLEGGITNRNWRIEVPDGDFVLRVSGKDTNLLGIDRREEYAASLVAASVGVGPEVEAFLEPEESLVTRFIEGGPIAVEDMRTSRRIEQVATTLRKLHDGPSIPGRFDSFEVVESYKRIAEERGVKLPSAYEGAKAQADEIKRARGSQPTRPCHNDLLNANFIDDGSTLRIVDWEYAGMGDHFFDLANFSVNHEFEAEHDEALLESYLGAPSRRDRASLELMRFMSDFREAMWGVVQQGISELDFDFKAYADEHFERMERTSGSASFRQALESSP
ncbi:MAG: phosphotransferase [Actinomycetota bacterium]|nr:phosphotransferase [Actinomycetota bacterium]